MKNSADYFKYAEEKGIHIETLKLRLKFQCLYCCATQIRLFLNSLSTTNFEAGHHVNKQMCVFYYDSFIEKVQTVHNGRFHFNL